MGYTSGDFTIACRLERHNGPGDEADNEAFRRLQDEIRMMIEADPDYRRIDATVYGCDLP